MFSFFHLACWPHTWYFYHSKWKDNKKKRKNMNKTEKQKIYPVVRLHHIPHHTMWLGCHKWDVKYHHLANTLYNITFIYNVYISYHLSLTRVSHWDENLFDKWGVAKTTDAVTTTLLIPERGYTSRYIMKQVKCINIYVCMMHICLMSSLTSTLCS